MAVVLNSWHPEMGTFIMLKRSKSMGVIKKYCASIVRQNMSVQILQDRMMVALSQSTRGDVRTVGS